MIYPVDSVIHFSNNLDLACCNWDWFGESFQIQIKFLFKDISLHASPSGAIIGDGDRKRAPFLVLGLARCGTFFSILSLRNHLRHARTCCEDFCGWRAGEMASKIPEIFYAFGPQFNAFMSVGILLKCFRRKLLQFEWSKTVSNLGMSRFISLTK